jgi:hypothetical protein
MTRGLAAAAMVVGSTLGADDARAQTPVLVRVDYSAAAGCPSASTFAADLSAQSRRTRIVDEGAPERSVTVIVRIEARGARYVGNATFSEKGKPETERHIDGDSCAEVAHALAFVSAVAIDGPEAQTEPKKTTPDNKSLESKTPETKTPEHKTSDNKTSEPALSESKSTARSPERESEQREPEGRGSQGKPASFAFAAGANGQAVSGATPSVLFAVPLFVEMTRARDNWGQSVRVRFERVSGSTQLANAGADFTWTVVSLDACPLMASSGWLRADACVRADAGALDASGAGVVPARSSSRPWVSLGAAARGRWEFAAPFFLEGEAALDFPMVRDRFFVQPDTTIFQPPVAGWSVAAGLGMTLF